MCKNDHETRMKYAEVLGALSSILFNEHGLSLLSFEFEGMVIYDPFLDETGRFEVDPVEYYGEAFLNSVFYSPENYDIFELLDF